MENLPESSTEIPPPPIDFWLHPWIWAYTKLFYCFKTTKPLQINLNLELFIVSLIIYELFLFGTVYVNHRPAFGLDMNQLKWAFEVLGYKTNNTHAIDRDQLLDLLQNYG